MARFLSMRFAFIASSSAGLLACTALLGDFEVGASGTTDSGSPDTSTTDSGADVIGDVVPDVKPGGFSGVRQIASGARHTCALANLGEIYCWGDNSLGQLAQPTSITRLTKPKKVDLGAAGAAKDLVAGANHTCVVTAGDAVVCWGSNACGQTGTGDTMSPSQPHVVRASTAPALKQWAAVGPGVDHTCAVDQSGATYCWGCNTAGQAGPTAGPLLIADPAGSEKGPYKAIVGSARHTCALTSDTKQVKCWGTEDKGALGNGAPAAETSTSALPVNFGTGAEATQIVVGGGHSCALLASGDLRCWGDNAQGQLGITPAGSFLDAPGNKVGNLNIVEIAAGGDTTCGIGMLGRTLACVGSNSNGQLGRGGAKDSSPHPDPAPVVRPGSPGLPLDGVAHVSVGREHACAIVGLQGEVLCWGNGADGQLGDGTSGGDARTTPVSVALPE